MRVARDLGLSQVFTEIPGGIVTVMRYNWQNIFKFCFLFFVTMEPIFHLISIYFNIFPFTPNQWNTIYRATFIYTTSYCKRSFLISIVAPGTLISYLPKACSVSGTLAIIFQGLWDTLNTGAQTCSILPTLPLKQPTTYALKEVYCMYCTVRIFLLFP